MNKNIKYLIEDIVNFNPADYSEKEYDIISDQEIDALCIYPKTTDELKKLIAERLVENPESPYLLDIDTCEITDMSGIFNDDSYNYISTFTNLPVLTAKNEYLEKYNIRSENIKELDLHTWNTSNVTDMHNMFAGCDHLIKLNITGWNTSNVKDMTRMFFYCCRIPEVRIYKPNGIKWEDMFSNCYYLTGENIIFL